MKGYPCQTILLTKEHLRRTWQEEWKNYIGKDWWKAQGINLVGAVGVKVIVEIFTGMP